MENKVYYTKTIEKSLKYAFNDLSKALKKFGFGVLVSIDVKKTLKEKIGVLDFYPYLILGVCNPKLAYSALTKNKYVGLLLPCNIVLLEKIPGKTTIALLDPLSALGLLNDKNLKNVGSLAKERLLEALNSLE